MVTTPLKPKNAGQPPIADWEKWRTIAWIYEVQRQAQMKMDLLQLPVDNPLKLPGSDPFFRFVKVIQTRWSKPQRKTQKPGIVTMNDLGDIFLENQKTGFYKYANGERARLKDEIINEVEKALPGTKSLYACGPDGIPLWAALAGKITVDDFWEPLVMSGQVSDALVVLSGWFDWREAGVRAPQPELEIILLNEWVAAPRSELKIFKKGVGAPHPESENNQDKSFTTGSYDDALRYEAKVILPTVSWETIVSQLSDYFAPFYLKRELDESISAAMIDLNKITLGEATLVIAMAQLALNDPNAEPDPIDDLRQILIGLVPFWRGIDAASGAPKLDIASTVMALASSL